MPVPGMLTVRVFLPEVLMLVWKPFPPNEMLDDFLPTLRRTPGATLKLFLNLNPTIDASSLR